MDEDIMRIIKTVYGILFFLGWAVVGWIREKVTGWL